jgi:adenine deaminase
MVFCAGRQVTDLAFKNRKTVSAVGRSSVKAPVVSSSSFRVSDNDEKTNVIGIIEGKIITNHLKDTISIHNGDKAPDLDRDLIRIAVIERHGINGNIATGFVHGFGMKSGAIAATVAHDHHNIVAVGVNYEDLALATNRLSDIEGGFVIADNGKIIKELPLPIAGLMSAEPFEIIWQELKELRKAANQLGVTLEEPFLQLSFLALPVIPALKITDRGLVDVNKFEII